MSLRRIARRSSVSSAKASVACTFVDGNIRGHATVRHCDAGAWLLIGNGTIIAFVLMGLTVEHFSADQDQENGLRLHFQPRLVTLHSRLQLQA